MGNEVITTVCDAIIRDPNTHVALFYGKTNGTSSFELSMKNTDVRGGRNNPLVFRYMHDRDLKITIDTVTTNEQILAMNVGSDILNGAHTVLGTECVTLDASGNGTLSNVPTAAVDVQLQNGLIVNVAPVINGQTATISIPAAANQSVTAMYTYSATTDRVDIGTTTPPKVVELYMIGEIRDSDTGNIVKKMQFFVPKLQVDGSYKLDFKSDGTSTESLTGQALSVQGTDCTSGDVYGYVDWIPVSEDEYTLSAIAATPAIYEPTHGTAATQQINVIGIRGNGEPTTPIQSGATFTKDSSGAASITVSTTGLISVAESATAGDTANITVSYTSGSVALTDVVEVTVA